MTFLFLLPLSNLFRCHCHVLLYSKTPKQVFFNPINILTSFTHSITVFIILQGEGDKNKKKTKRRKKIDTKGKGKKKKVDGFTASSAAEVFYRSMVAAAERETKAAGDEKLEAEARIIKMKQKAKTEAVLRKRADREMKKMREEIAKLKEANLHQESNEENGTVAEVVVEEQVSLKDKFKRAAKKASALKLF